MTRLTLARQVAQGCVVDRLRAHGALVRANVLQQTPAVHEREQQQRRDDDDYDGDPQFRPPSSVST